MRLGIDIRVAAPVEPGQERYLWRLGAWLAEQGHDVHFLTVRDQPAEVVAPPGTTVHRLVTLSRARLRGAISDLSLDVLLLNPERSRRYRSVPANVLRPAYGTEQYRQKLRSFRNPIERALRSGLRATPWVRAERTWERNFYEGRDPAPAIIAQSQYMREQILEDYSVPAARVHVVHNPIDTGEYSPIRRAGLRAEMRARWSIPSGAFCLLFLGHNFRLKGLWQVLEVLPKLGDGDPPICLLVAGRGTGRVQRRKAESLVRSLGLGNRVRLVGPIRPSLHALAAADALLHLSWHDAFGFVTLEAMACGLPVVTTRYAGSAELIEDGVSGIVVDPGDDEEIVRAIRSLSDPDARERMGTAAAPVGAGQDEPSHFRRVLSVMECARERTGPIAI
jgi:UDP-glucose:(heptosyl)LPS alpha-1,3-glucosyltransferase